MSSCQGELPEKEFTVIAVDQNGRVLVNGTMTTLKNGFLELWFPRDRRIELTIQRFKQKGRGIIDTFDNSKTCVTTFRLS